MLHRTVSLALSGEKMMLRKWRFALRIDYTRHIECCFRLHVDWMELQFVLRVNGRSTSQRRRTRDMVIGMDVRCERVTVTRVTVRLLSVMRIPRETICMHRLVGHMPMPPAEIISSSTQMSNAVVDGLQRL